MQLSDDPLDMSTAAPSLRASLLVVDDQPINIKVVHQIFNGIHQVLMATSGEQAIELCLKSPPDLILLDVAMPGIDGLETCRRLKQLEATRDIPIIFVTGGQHAEDENVCWEVGGVDFVSKPINALTLRNRVRAHLQLKQQADMLRELAFQDGLTSVANRRYFDERYGTELRRAKRGATPLSLVMIDVDNFKRYNDHYGHQSGDECLRAVALALKKQLNRPADLLARYGGEEFVCILPETDIGGASQTAERLRLAVEQLALPHAASDSSKVVTVSVGVASITAVADDAALSLLTLADQQLYLAKHGGRNRISSQSFEDIKR